MKDLLGDTGKDLDKLGSPSTWEQGVAGLVDNSDALKQDGINYSQLITDDVFTRWDSMTEADIQAFLDKFPDNIIKHTIPVWEYGGDGHKHKTNRTVNVAHLIAVLAKVFRINPKLLLVRMEMEEQLVTGLMSPDGGPVQQIGEDWKAMILGCGFGVYDGRQQTADTNWSGIDRQLVLAAYLFRQYFNGLGKDMPTKYPVTFTTDEGNVLVLNRATYALYLYTPHTVTDKGQGNVAFVRCWRDFFGTGSLGSN